MQRKIDRIGPETVLNSTLANSTLTLQSFRCLVSLALFFHGGEGGGASPVEVRVKARRVGEAAQHLALFVPLPFQILCFLFLGLLSWNCGPRFKAITHPICAFAILVRRAMERERHNEIWCGRGKKHLARSMEGRSGEGLVQGSWFKRNLERPECWASTSTLRAFTLTSSGLAPPPSPP